MTHNFWVISQQFIFIISNSFSAISLQIFPKSRKGFFQTTILDLFCWNLFCGSRFLLLVYFVHQIIKDFINIHSCLGTCFDIFQIPFWCECRNFLFRNLKWRNKVECVFAVKRRWCKSYSTKHLPVERDQDQLYYQQGWSGHLSTRLSLSLFVPEVQWYPPMILLWGNIWPLITVKFKFFRPGIGF